MAKLRLGIDVGGTFTDVVAIDARSRAIVARVKVPTTHDAAEGVAAGIVDGIRAILARPGVAVAEIAFIAHSTTQATNALLEGDVAPVGVVGIPRRAGWLARRQMRFGALDLARGVQFTPEFAFARGPDGASIRNAVDALLARGVEAIAASAPFGVDDPRSERMAVDYARDRGVAATAGHDVSATYGLRARTRTAAVNAAILPRMIRTARMTAKAVADASIGVPLMVMRSDGGVMDVREVERRPILTLLSGPAAGVAGALLHERCSDGIFIEVGGTSADCSAIRAGRPQMHPAKIGGHRMLLRTLDVRTLGIGGGSLARVRGGTIVEVGPRSAHIAGFRYACFLTDDELHDARVDADGAYAALLLRDGSRAALTPTCAANALGYVPDGSFAFVDPAVAKRAFALWSAAVGGDPERHARTVLERAAEKLRAGVEALIADYAFVRARIVLVGGGGGAGALVPFAAEALDLPFRIARDAEVISPVGVALALVRESVERTLVDPTPAEIARLRRDASDRVVASGAAPERVEVLVEIDPRRNLVRATASGATAGADALDAIEASESERRAAAAASFGCSPDDLTHDTLSAGWSGYRRGDGLRLVDRRAVVRLSLHEARVCLTTVAALAHDARASIEASTRFGDVGRALPNLYALRGERLAEFAGLGSTEQAVALVVEEVAGAPPDERVILLLEPRRA